MSKSRDEWGDAPLSKPMWCERCQCDSDSCEEPETHDAEWVLAAEREKWGDSETVWEMEGGAMSKHKHITWINYCTECECDADLCQHPQEHKADDAWVSGEELSRQARQTRNDIQQAVDGGE